MGPWGPSTVRVVNDRRRTSRVAARGEVLLHTSSGPVTARCVDISTGGLSVDVPATSRFNKRLRVAWAFDQQTIELEATVARRRKIGSVLRIGLRFGSSGSVPPAEVAEIVRVLQVHAAFARQSVAFAGQLPQLRLPGTPAPAVASVPPGPGPSSLAGPGGGPPSSGRTVPAPPGFAPPSTPTAPPPTLESFLASVGARAPAPMPPLVPLDRDEAWRDDDLETAQFLPMHGQPPEPAPRRTLLGVPGPARTGDTVIAPFPRPPARTGDTVVMPRAQLQPDPDPETTTTQRRRRK